MATERTSEDRLPLTEAEIKQIHDEIADQQLRKRKDHGCGPYGLLAMLALCCCPVIVVRGSVNVQGIYLCFATTCAVGYWIYINVSWKRDYDKKIARLQTLLDSGYAVERDFEPTQYAILRDPEANCAFWLLDLGDTGSVIVRPGRKKRPGSRLAFREIFFGTGERHKSATTNEGAAIPCVGEFKLEAIVDVAEMEVDVRTSDRFEEVLERLRKAEENEEDEDSDEDDSTA